MSNKSGLADTSHIAYEAPKEYPHAGKMFQVIDGVSTEVVRWGSELLPKNHPIVSQIVGQLTLKGTNEIH